MADASAATNPTEATGRQVKQALSLHCALLDMVSFVHPCDEPGHRNFRYHNRNAQTVKRQNHSINRL